MAEDTHQTFFLVVGLLSLDIFLLKKFKQKFLLPSSCLIRISKDYENDKLETDLVFEMLSPL